MQKIILPDCLDGSRTSKTISMDSVKLMADLASIIYQGSPENLAEFEEKYPGLAKKCHEDFQAESFIMMYGEYLRSPKTYVCSSYLSEILRGTAVDIPTSFIPDNFNAFFEIPDLVHIGSQGVKLPVIGVFVSVIPTDSGTRLLHVQLLGKAPRSSHDQYKWSISTSTFRLELKEDMTIQECIDSEPTLQEEMMSHTSTSKIGTSWLTVLNATVFAANCTDGLLETYNEFSSKASKAEGQKRVYTTKGFYSLDIEKPRMVFSVDSTFVKGHFRWQKHGPKLCKVKLIYIAPTKRHFNTASESAPIMV